MKIKKKPKEIRAEYEKAKAFNQQINLYDTVEKNENFYAGEQWKGVNAPDLDKPVFNILKRVISYFIAMLVSDDIAVSIQPFDYSDAAAQQAFQSTHRVSDATANKKLNDFYVFPISIL